MKEKKMKGNSMRMKRAIGILIFLMVFGYDMTAAQIYDPIYWSYSSKLIAKDEAIVFIKATLDKRWHIYSINMAGDTPIPTMIAFEGSKDYQLMGKVEEPTPIKKYDNAFSKDIFYFENEVVFKQKIKLKHQNAIVKGFIIYMACTDQQCLPPGQITFIIPIKQPLKK